MPSIFTVPSAYPADLEVCAAATYTDAGVVLADGGDVYKPAATAPPRLTLAPPQLTPQAMEAAAAAVAPYALPAQPPYTPAAAKDDSPSMAAAVDAAAQDAMELFVSGTHAAPAYQLRGELGRGKYGRVYLVEECVQRRMLAVKATYDPAHVAALRERQRRLEQKQQQQQQQPRGSGAGASPPHPPHATQRTDDCAVPHPAGSPHRFSNEVACLRECHSPFIVRLEGAEKGENGEDLLIMEYVDCGDLRQEIRRRRATATPFTETEAVFVFLQLCMAVDHLHQLNMLHHDLKPENIMLSSTGAVKLGDFGFARKYTEPVCHRVASTGCGTPYYLSPEALRGDRYSLKSEMWALGVILYELLALSGPFVAATRAELRAKVHDSHYAALPSHYSEELRSVCYQLLSLHPDHRPSTQDLFHGSEYLREKLNALRRVSECSVKMTTAEKGSMFHSISAALRRRTPPSPKVAAVTCDLDWGSGCVTNSHALSSDASSVARRQWVGTRVEAPLAPRANRVC